MTETSRQLPTWISWSRPDSGRVRHLMIKQMWQWGSYAACGYVSRDNHHLFDESPKCKRCLKQYHD